MSPKGKLNIAAAAQTAPPTHLDPKLMDFCSRLNITPAIREFYDDGDESYPDLPLNQSSDIEEESELKSSLKHSKKHKLLH
jgi:hypothetical protein